MNIQVTNPAPTADLFMVKGRQPRWKSIDIGADLFRGAGCALLASQYQRGSRRWRG